MAALLLATRWYTWDDWRETTMRVLFWVGLVLSPVAAMIAVRQAAKARNRHDAWAKTAAVLAWSVLVLLGIAVVVGLVAWSIMAGA